MGLNGAATTVMTAIIVRTLLVSIAVLLPLSIHAFDLPEVPLSVLPTEVAATIRSIQHGGPFPYRKDGVVFGNREHRLPPQAHGYYREYTVPTADAHHRASSRGARRIVAGRVGEYYYSDDHYRTFRRIRE